MGSFYINKRIRSYILIFLIVLSVFIAIPIKRSISSLIDTTVNHITTDIYEKTGLKISYETLSPSILTSFNVKGIKISDNDDEILFVDNIKVSYSIFKLIKKDIQNGISSVLIDGINLDVNQALNVLSLFQKKQSESKNKMEFADVIALIPKNIRLKNLNFEFNNESIGIKYYIKDITVNGKQHNQALGIDLNSTLNVNFPSLKTNVGVKIGASGAITNTFDNSQVNIKLSDISSGKMKFNKLNFHVAFNDNIIKVRTIQVTNPISVNAIYNTKTNEITSSVVTDNIRLGSLLNTIKKNKFVKQFKDTVINTNTTVYVNLNDKKLKFSSDNGIRIADNAIDGGLAVDFLFRGDEKHVELKKFKVENNKINVSGDLSLLFDGFHLSGILSVPYFFLPNGNAVSTEVYFEPLKQGFMGFAPEVIIGGSVFTAMQLQVLPESDSIDFALEMSDYSHVVDGGGEGSLKIDGSYLLKSKYLQSSISLNTLYLDSITNAASEFLEKESYKTLRGMESTLSPYVLSGDVYFSTDLKSISYNIPYVLLANTKKDNQVVMFALNGTEQSIQLNQFSLVYGKFALQANALIDKDPSSSDLFFDFNITSAAVPYHFSGTIMPNLITIGGDYGTSLQIIFEESGKIESYLGIENLPVVMAGKSFVLSTDSEIRYDKENGPSVKINRFETEMVDIEKTVNPRLVFSGSGTKYGVQLDSVSFTDFYSALEGRADIMVDFSEGVLDGASLNLDLQNPLSSESIVVSGNVSNPDRVGFDTPSLLNNYYLDFLINVNALGLNRFSEVQHDANNVTGSVYVSGTVMHPYLTVGLENFSMYIGNSLLKTQGSLMLEDRELSIIDMGVKFGGINFNNITATASLDTFDVEVGCDFNMGLMGKELVAPIKIRVKDAYVPEESFMPQSFNAVLEMENINGSFVRKPFPLRIEALYSPEGIFIDSPKNIGLSGFVTPDGIIQVNQSSAGLSSFKLDGFVSGNQANLQLYDVRVDLAKVCEYIDISSITNFEKGILTGEVIVSNSLTNPDIDGNLVISTPICTLPFITPEKVSTKELRMNIVDNVIEIPQTLLKAKSGDLIRVSFNIYLNRWALDYVEGTAKTPGKDLFPGNLFMGIITIEGDVSVDLDLFFQNNVFEITGDVFGENMELSSGLSSFTKIKKTDKKDKSEKREESKLMFKTDLDVTLGTHASISFAPILRCILVPNTKLDVIIDQANNEYKIDGELKLRSGDIAYLNRSFYIKNGAIKFNMENIANPLVTLRAETREHDDRGEPVKIILDVENQYLLDISPRFRSEPAKSETEIQRLLGQIVVADSDSPTDFLFAASDFAFQSTFVRQLENKLRNFLNFDIFSIRTNVLQNTLNMGISGNLSKENFSIGNFFDNSTVYIGKYLGSSLYLDAMLHISFEQNVYNDITAPGSIIFQPEIGLEMESPFANIRFNLAPDINALIKNNQFVPSTSVTLSWNFTF